MEFGNLETLEIVESEFLKCVNFETLELRSVELKCWTFEILNFALFGILDTYKMSAGPSLEGHQGC